MQRHIGMLGVIVLAALMTGTGCRSTHRAAKSEIPIPPDSPLAKIELGMDMKQVFDAIGVPTDTASHVTGKSFIPLYIGGDTSRSVSLYKGQGRVVFSRKSAFGSDLRVIKIEYDPNESGAK